jgi:hypothetical protein
MTKLAKKEESMPYNREATETGHENKKMVKLIQKDFKVFITLYKELKEAAIKEVKKDGDDVSHRQH